MDFDIATTNIPIIPSSLGFEPLVFTAFDRFTVYKVRNKLVMKIKPTCDFSTYLAMFAQGVFVGFSDNSILLYIFISHIVS